MQLKGNTVLITGALRESDLLPVINTLLEASQNSSAKAAIGNSKKQERRGRLCLNNKQPIWLIYFLRKTLTRVSLSPLAFFSFTSSTS